MRRRVAGGRPGAVARGEPARWEPVLEGRLMKPTCREPTFLAVRWEAEAAYPERAGVVVLEAILCYAHRRQLRDRYPNT